MPNYPILYNTERVRFGRLTANADILLLFNQIFSRQFKEEWLHWLAACPTGANQWYGAFDGDVPIGLYGLLPIRVQIGDRAYEAALCNNVGILPQFQGKGLFQALGEYALTTSQFPLVIGIPNAKAAKGHKRIGWKNYGVLELLERTTADRSIDFVDLASFQYLANPTPRYFHLIKDIDFVRWRYSKPGVKYHQSFFPGSKYIIWKIYENKNQVLETNDVHLVSKLGGTVNVWQFRASQNSVSLQSQGFKPILSNEFILYLNQPIPLQSDVELFQFELGDNDVF